MFLKVVRSIGTFRGEADIKTWMFSIARHEWYDYLRKKNRQIRTEALNRVMWTGIYSIFVVVGIVIAGLIHYAFRKE